MSNFDLIWLISCISPFLCHLITSCSTSIGAGKSWVNSWHRVATISSVSQQVQLGWDEIGWNRTSFISSENHCLNWAVMWSTNGENMSTLKYLVFIGLCWISVLVDISLTMHTIWCAYISLIWFLLFSALVLGFVCGIQLDHSRLLEEQHSIPEWMLAYICWVTKAVYVNLNCSRLLMYDYASWSDCLVESLLIMKRASCTCPVS